MNTNSKNQSGMTPLFVAIAIVVVMAIVGAAWFVVARNSDDDANNDDSSGTSQSDAVTFEGTMFDALRESDGKTLECDWTLNYEGEALVSEGKIYTEGSIIRSTAYFESEGETHQTNAVIGKGEIYDWYDNDSSSTAKTPLSEIEGQPPMEDTYARSGQIDPNANYSFVCQEWEVDDAMYEIPIPINSLPSQGQ